MTQEEKELALRDLCARLPYGINCEYQGKVHGIVGFNHGKVTIYEHFQSEPKFPFVEEVKLYLFPMSNMTEEQKFEFHSLQVENSKNGNYSTINECSIIIDWCHKNHFDYRGLIPMGLAKDATGLNIY